MLLLACFDSTSVVSSLLVRCLKLLCKRMMIFLADCPFFYPVEEKIARGCRISCRWSGSGGGGAGITSEMALMSSLSNCSSRLCVLDVLVDAHVDNGLADADAKDSSVYAPSCNSVSNSMRIATTETCVAYIHITKVWNQAPSFHMSRPQGNVPYRLLTRKIYQQT